MYQWENNLPAEVSTFWAVIEQGKPREHQHPDGPEFNPSPHVKFALEFVRCQAFEFTVYSVF